jgi:L-alanine-DL-glutamate epimerase-like enolase superfamily enzyme
MRRDVSGRLGNDGSIPDIAARFERTARQAAAAALIVPRKCGEAAKIDESFTGLPHERGRGCREAVVCALPDAIGTPCGAKLCKFFRALAHILFGLHLKSKSATLARGESL